LKIFAEGPAHSIGGTKINSWRYNSTSPIHNVGKYDLWAEVIIGNNTNVIGNWKE
jgi:hypothetical protein